MDEAEDGGVQCLPLETKLPEKGAQACGSASIDRIPQ
jgi:hypothetical protein